MEEANGWIEPSSSPWNFRSVLVDKPGGKKRHCINFGPVNPFIKDCKYPIPHLEELLDLLAGFSVFSGLDLSDGYHQMPVHPDDRDILSFTTRRGKWRYRFLPFGIKIAGEYFHGQLASKLSPELLWLFLLLYIDDWP